MSANQRDARELVRALIKEHIPEKNIGKTIDYEGEQIHISKEDGAIRFDLIGMRKAFVLRSNRLYASDFKPLEPASEQQFQKQLNYLGLVEEVDAQAYSNKLVCKCGNVRWVKNADLFQVKKCKPCTYRERKERRKKRPAAQ
ncbi:MAG: hypothetical protein JSV60_08095 [Desulfobacterales bacterium]|nr:MAG: hypothetical protein JSV60_08095 [Desulfobacterales bacterium]